MPDTPGTISNTAIATAISALVDRWNTRENQMIALLSQPTGDVTVTNGVGVNFALPSFPQLQLDVAAMIDDLTGEASSAQFYANEALQHRNAAAASATTAASAVGSVDAAVADAAASKNSAAASATSATGSATSATASSAAALSSKNAAASSATAAGTSATTATAGAGTATTQAGLASMAKVDAEAARDKASLFANAPQGTLVETGLYSAKHWAAQAQAAVTGTLTYMGSWDASTTVYPTSPAKGHFYKVSVGGTAGGVTYAPSDQILYNGTGWDKIDNTDQVSSVAGRMGAVALVAGDIGGLGALAAKNTVDWTTEVTGKQTTYTPAAHSHATTDITSGVFVDALIPQLAISKTAGLQAALDLKAPIASPSWTGTPIAAGGIFQIGATAGSNVRIRFDGTISYNGNATYHALWSANNFNPASKQDALGWLPVRAGGGSGMQANSILIGWSGSKVLMQVDSTPVGSIASESWATNTFATAASVNAALAGKADLANADFTGNIGVANTAYFYGQVLRKNNNNTAMIVQPRIFVQSIDPIAASVDGDLWIF